MTRPTCLTRLALRRLATWENLLIGCIVTGTAASVVVAAWVGLVVWRLV